MDNNNSLKREKKTTFIKVKKQKDDYKELYAFKDARSLPPFARSQQHSRQSPTEESRRERTSSSRTGEEQRSERSERKSDRKRASDREPESRYSKTYRRHDYRSRSKDSRSPDVSRRSGRTTPRSSRRYKPRESPSPPPSVEHYLTHSKDFLADAHSFVHKGAEALVKSARFELRQDDPSATDHTHTGVNYFDSSGDVPGLINSDDLPLGDPRGSDSDSLSLSLKTRSDRALSSDENVSDKGYDTRIKNEPSDDEDRHSQDLSTESPREDEDNTEDNSRMSADLSPGKGMFRSANFDEDPVMVAEPTDIVGQNRVCMVKSIELTPKQFRHVTMPVSGLEGSHRVKTELKLQKRQQKGFSMWTLDYTAEQDSNFGKVELVIKNLTMRHIVLEPSSITGSVSFSPGDAINILSTIINHPSSDSPDKTVRDLLVSSVVDQSPRPSSSHSHEASNATSEQGEIDSPTDPKVFMLINLIKESPQQMEYVKAYWEFKHYTKSKVDVLQCSLHVSDLEAVDELNWDDIFSFNLEVNTIELFEDALLQRLPDLKHLPFFGPIVEVLFHSFKISQKLLSRVTTIDWNRILALEKEHLGNELSDELLLGDSSLLGKDELEQEQEEEAMEDCESKHEDQYEIEEGHDEGVASESGEADLLKGLSPPLELGNVFVGIVAGVGENGFTVKIADAHHEIKSACNLPSKGDRLILQKVDNSFEYQIIDNWDEYDHSYVGFVSHVSFSKNVVSVTFFRGNGSVIRYADLPMNAIMFAADNNANNDFSIGTEIKIFAVKEQKVEEYSALIGLIENLEVYHTVAYAVESIDSFEDKLVEFETLSKKHDIKTRRIIHPTKISMALYVISKSFSNFVNCINVAFHNPALHDLIYNVFTETAQMKCGFTIKADNMVPQFKVYCQENYNGEPSAANGAPSDSTKNILDINQSSKEGEPGLTSVEMASTTAIMDMSTVSEAPQQVPSSNQLDQNMLPPNSLQEYNQQMMEDKNKIVSSEVSPKHVAGSSALHCEYISQAELNFTGLCQETACRRKDCLLAHYFPPHIKFSFCKAWHDKCSIACTKSSRLKAEEISADFVKQIKNCSIACVTCNFDRKRSMTDKTSDVNETSAVFPSDSQDAGTVAHTEEDQGATDSDGVWAVNKSEMPSSKKVVSDCPKVDFPIFSKTGITIGAVEKLSEKTTEKAEKLANPAQKNKMRCKFISSQMLNTRGFCKFNECGKKSCCHYDHEIPGHIKFSFCKEAHSTCLFTCVRPKQTTPGVVKKMQSEYIRLIVNNYNNCSVCHKNEAESKGPPKELTEETSKEGNKKEHLVPSSVTNAPINQSTVDESNSSVNAQDALPTRGKTDFPDPSQNLLASKAALKFDSNDEVPPDKNIGLTPGSENEMLQTVNMNSEVEIIDPQKTIDSDQKEKGTRTGTCKHLVGTDVNLKGICFGTNCDKGCGKLHHIPNHIKFSFCKISHQSCLMCCITFTKEVTYARVNEEYNKLVLKNKDHCLMCFPREEKSQGIKEIITSNVQCQGKPINHTKGADGQSSKIDVKVPCKFVDNFLNVRGICILRHCMVCPPSCKYAHEFPSHFKCGCRESHKRNNKGCKFNSHIPHNNKIIQNMFKKEIQRLRTHCEICHSETLKREEDAECVIVGELISKSSPKKESIGKTSLPLKNMGKENGKNGLSSNLPSQHPENAASDSKCSSQAKSGGHEAPSSDTSNKLSKSNTLEKGQNQHSLSDVTDLNNTQSVKSNSSQAIIDPSVDNSKVTRSVTPSCEKEKLSSTDPIKDGEHVVSQEGVENGKSNIISASEEAGKKVNTEKLVKPVTKIENKLIKVASISSPEKTKTMGSQKPTESLTIKEGQEKSTNMLEAKKNVTNLQPKALKDTLSPKNSKESSTVGEKSSASKDNPGDSKSKAAARANETSASANIKIPCKALKYVQIQSQGWCMFGRGVCKNKACNFTHSIPEHMRCSCGGKDAKKECACILAKGNASYETKNKVFKNLLRDMKKHCTRCEDASKERQPISNEKASSAKAKLISEEKASSGKAKPISNEKASSAKAKEPKVSDFKPVSCQLFNNKLLKGLCWDFLKGCALKKCGFVHELPKHFNCFYCCGLHDKSSENCYFNASTISHATLNKIFMAEICRMQSFCKFCSSPETVETEDKISMPRPDLSIASEEEDTESSSSEFGCKLLTNFEEGNLCMYLRTTGCFKGDECDFVHDVPEHFMCPFCNGPHENLEPESAWNAHTSISCLFSGFIEQEYYDDLNTIYVDQTKRMKEHCSICSAETECESQKSPEKIVCSYFFRNGDCYFKDRCRFLHSDLRSHLRKKSRPKRRREDSGLASGSNSAKRPRALMEVKF